MISGSFAENDLWYKASSVSLRHPVQYVSAIYMNTHIYRCGAGSSLGKRRGRLLCVSNVYCIMIQCIKYIFAICVCTYTHLYVWSRQQPWEDEHICCMVVIYTILWNYVYNVYIKNVCVYIHIYVNVEHAAALVYYGTMYTMCILRIYVYIYTYMYMLSRQQPWQKTRTSAVFL